jgi:hypothetical protein
MCPILFQTLLVFLDPIAYSTVKLQSNAIKYLFISKHSEQEMHHSLSVWALKRYFDLLNSFQEFSNLLQ